jgi:hypothetical protein
MSFDATFKLITDGKLLHIAGTEALLRKLPAGNWIGGSTEYFMATDGGKVTGESLFVTEFPYTKFSITEYTVDSLVNIAGDAFDNGFSILIIPFDSAAHKEYAENAAGYPGIFMKNIAGWISGINLGIKGQTPIAVNGETAKAHADKAVALHMEVPEGRTVGINIVNIFTQDESSPVIEFNEEGLSVRSCLVDGKETGFADYIAQNSINTKLPLVGDYSGNGVNIAIKSIDDGVVHFYGPVFSGIKYRMAKSISDYDKDFNSRLAVLKSANTVFSCNCILNFLYGELEGKCIDTFAGPITFGEIAYQLVNQTLVYVTVD